jgi:hypothetical protein
MRLGSSGGEKIKKAVCMYMLTAFFISFLLILVDNSLVDDNVGNQSHYNQNGRTAQDGIVNIAGKRTCNQDYSSYYD